MAPTGTPYRTTGIQNRFSIFVCLPFPSVSFSAFLLFPYLSCPCMPYLPVPSPSFLPFRLFLRVPFRSAADFSTVDATSAEPESVRAVRWMRAGELFAREKEGTVLPRLAPRTETEADSRWRALHVWARSRSPRRG